MRKWLAILYVLFMIVAPQPTVGQASGHGGQVSQSAKDQTANGTSPSKPTITLIEKNCNNEKFKNDADCNRAENKEHIVAVSKLPTVNVAIQSNPERDGYEWTAYVFNIALAVAGILGVGIAVGTLFLIRAQVVEMRRQVQASHDGLRAWIGVVVRENYFPLIAMNTLEQMLSPSKPRFEWEIKNYGQTPAFVRSVEVSNFAYSEPKGILRPGDHLEVNGFLGAGQADTHLLTLPDYALNKCELGQMFWRVSVKVAYDDAFKRGHDTMVSFHYNVTAPVPKGFYQEIDRSTNYYN
jgi:hypothetical protein